MQFQNLTLICTLVARKGNRPSTSYVAPTIGPITKTVKSFYCNFDNGLCGLKQDQDDNIDFILHSGSTRTRNTGPSGDVPSGRGKIKSR